MRTAASLSIGAFIGFVVAESPAFTSDDADAYDAGTYGKYPVNSLKTTRFPSPRIILRQWSQACIDEDYFYFLSPYGQEVGTAGPLIIDSFGNLVWHHDNDPFVHSYGLTVQHYRGEPRLTWWTGDDWVRGHGFGSYYVLDNTYQEVTKLGVLNGVPADMHEFRMTKDDTALVTAYVKIAFDLTSYGSEDGYIWDGIFQEYDIQTRQLLFEWRASDHVDLSATALSISGGVDSNGTIDFPWDWFHINSVDKDRHGNYLVSARSLWSLLYVNGRTGEVEWYLGGPKNEFKDWSDGAATDFKWQHDARWTDDFNAITLFDNQVRLVQSDSRASRGSNLPWIKTARRPAY